MTSTPLYPVTCYVAVGDGAGNLQAAAAIRCPSTHHRHAEHVSDESSHKQLRRGPGASPQGEPRREGETCFLCRWFQPVSAPPSPLSALPANTTQEEPGNQYIRA